MRVIAILAAYNEERFIGGCIEHLYSQGVESYLVDNGSTDRTVEIAESYLGRELIGVEHFPRERDEYRWSPILERKEELAATLDADWFMHADPDEVRLSPRPSGQTLTEAFEEVDAKGFDAVNFLEYTFVPTREDPDHDHPDFRETMRWYYPFVRNFPYQIKAWKRQPGRVELARSGGHRVRFADQMLYPEPFKMRHYPFLSVGHVLEKYVEKGYDPVEVRRGWHGFRSKMERERIVLPSRSELKTYVSDDDLDYANPRPVHAMAGWAPPKSAPVAAPTGRPEVVPAGVPQGTADGLPVVVGGCYHPVASLLREALDAHPRLRCGPNLGLFGNDSGADDSFVASARRMLGEDRLLGVLGPALLRLREEDARLAGKARWADHDPENVLHLKDWRVLLGKQFLFVHVVRNPLDAVVAMAYDLAAEAPAAGAKPDLDALANLYKRYTRVGLKFEERHPERSHRIVYERLVERPEEVLSGLMSWLGERLNPAQLEPFRSPEAASSVGAWKRLLSPDEAERVGLECDRLWRRVYGEPGKAGS